MVAAMASKAKHQDRALAACFARFEHRVGGREHKLLGALGLQHLGAQSFVEARRS